MNNLRRMKPNKGKLLPVAMQLNSSKALNLLKKYSHMAIEVCPKP